MSLKIYEDIPLDDRRKRTFERLRYKVTRERHEVSLSNDNDLLIIYGTAVVTLSNGYVRTNTQYHSDGGH